MKKAIAFDFLGVIAKHDGNAFISEEEYLTFEPNKEVVEAMRLLRAEDYKVIIYSTLPEELLAYYCKKYNIVVDEINKNSDYGNGNVGKPVASVYIDDRAIQYAGQTAETLKEQVKKFKPYWKE